MIKDWIRKLIGAYDTDERLKAIEMQLHQYKGLIADQRHNISVTNLAIGRVVAKLDPLFATPEDDPARVAASKALGEYVIKKIKSEHAASNKLTGEFE